jgi:hypothetical protein
MSDNPRGSVLSCCPWFLVGPLGNPVIVGEMNGNVGLLLKLLDDGKGILLGIVKGG